MELSIVTTLYNTRAFINEFYQSAVAAAERHFSTFEIVFVNDGSPDGSLEAAVALSKNDPRVVVVDLSKNFGHHRAMMTGLDYAEGDLIFLIDSDMEEDPDCLDVFVARMRQEQCDVVYGVQDVRRGNLGERISGAIFYWLMGKLTDIKLPRNLLTARLMTRRYVDSLLLHREREMVISGLWVITGYDQVAEVVRKTRRRDTGYSIAWKIRLAIDYSTTFSSNILYYVMYVGIVISVISFLGILGLVANRLFLGAVLEGWTSVMASVWLLGGINILFVGLVGTYVARIFSETKMRPYVIVREVYGRNKDQSARPLNIEVAHEP